jgi:hypothetical protein
MKSTFLTKTFHGVVCALVLSAIFPVAALGQRRWEGRSHRSRIVIYNERPRPYVIYQRRPNYGYRSYTYGYPQTYYGNQYYTSGYPQPYYGNQYYTYGSSQPDYTTQYYSYRYSQPYFANRYTYAWANPTYRYDGYRYRQRDRRSRIRIGIRLP